MLDLLVKRFTALCTAVFTCALATCFCSSQPHKKTNSDRHNIHYGRELITYKQNRKVAGSTYKGRRRIGSSRIAYEYISPNALYFGVDLANAYAVFRGSAGKDSLDKSAKWEMVGQTFANYNVNLGYTMANAGEVHLISPFLGLGYYYFIPDSASEWIQADHFCCLALGAKYKYRLRNTISLSANVKLLYIFSGQAKIFTSTGTLKQGQPRWGSEISAPLTWHPKGKKWELALGPYFATFGFSGRQIAYGGRLTWGLTF